MKWRDIAVHLAARDDEFLDTECNVLITDGESRKEATVIEIADGGLKVEVTQYKWLIHWKDGATETVIGSTFATAFSRKYGAGAISAIDEYELIHE